MKDITKINFQNKDIEELLNNLLDKALALTNAQIGSSFVVDSESNRLRLVNSRGIEGMEKGTYINLDDSIIKLVIDEKKPLLVKDIENDPRIQKKNNPKYGSPSFLSMPIYMGQKDDVTAVLNLSHKKTGGSFDTNDENVVSTMMVEIRLTLENALLQSQISEYIKDIEDRNIQLEQEITERKRAEKIQKKLHEELMQAEKLAAVGACAAGIAHEVKNPLAIIVQGIEYLKTCTGSDPLLVDVVERVKKSALRADSIVKGLLSFTHQMPIETEKAEIIPIIEETVSFIEHQFNAKHITVVRRYPSELPMINIDSNQIKQVFINILLNSVEAMEGGGIITIGIEKIKSESNQQYVQISFADTGYGISEDKIDKVFDPFFTTKDKRGNAGLGLSITKGIIDKHHGTIRVESKIQEGMKVIIGLPVISLR